MQLGDAARGHFALVFFSLFVAGTYSLGSFAAPHIDPDVLMMLRFVLSAMLLGVLIALRNPTAFKQIVAPWRYLLLGSIFAIYFVCLFEALRLTTAISTGVMFTLTPFLTAGFAWLLLRQVTSQATFLALAIAAVGAVWVIFRGDVNALLAFDIGKGEQIFLIGIVAHAIYIPLVRYLDRGEPVILQTLGVLVGGSIPLLIVSLPNVLQTDWPALPVIVWIALAYIVVFATLITFVLLMYGTRRLPSTKVMAYTYLIPCWVILWDAMLGRGLPENSVYIGVALTVAAMLLLLRPEKS